MIVDSHQHFWNLARATYEWMTGEFAVLRRRFEPVDLAPQLAGCDVTRTIAVQARSSLDETVYLLELASQYELVGGVVGWVDLTANDLGATLAELASMPGGGKLVGIRHQVHDEPDPEWLLRDDVQRGLDKVGEAGLVFDLLVRARELPAAVATVACQRETPFVVDHLAKPPVASGEDREWAVWMQRMSVLPNVAVKLSGLVTEDNWERWTRDRLVPYAGRAFEWFGAERVLFGSDWPVCTLAASYEEVFSAYRSLVEEFAPGNVSGVFGSNAERIYGLAP
jgi:L-fuconolactonase